MENIEEYVKYERPEKELFQRLIDQRIFQPHYINGQLIGYKNHSGNLFIDKQESKDWSGVMV